VQTLLSQRLIYAGQFPKPTHGIVVCVRALATPLPIHATHLYLYLSGRVLKYFRNQTHPKPEHRLNMHNIFLIQNMHDIWTGGDGNAERFLDEAGFRV
jgi:hypothetical protein